MTRCVWLAALAALPQVALAQTPASPQGAPPPIEVTPLPAPPSWIARPAAEVQALDKITARDTPITLRIGQVGTFGSLTIVVRSCVIRPPDQPADAAAFLDITDSHPGLPQFHGWMFVSAPAAAMLEHPVYDIHLSGCRA